MFQERGKKTFWHRPEGTLSMILIVVLAIIIIFNFAVILAFILSLFQSVITTIIAFVVLGAIAFVLIDSSFRNLIWFVYKRFLRKITGVFVQLNPIKMLESYIDDLKKSHKKMEVQLLKLRGQIAKLSAIMSRNKREMKDSLKKAQHASNKNNKELVALYTRQYGRLQDANHKYEKLHKKLELLHIIIDKIHRNSKYLISDTENEVRMRKQEYKAITAGHKAMRRAANIIQGNPDQKMMFDLATEALADDVFDKIGDMQRFVEISSDFIESVDLQSGIYEDDGLELLEKMQKEGVSFLLNDNLSKGNKSEKDVEIENDHYTEYNNLFK